MKKLHLLLLTGLSILFINPLYSQSLGQDAEGYSTIIVPSTSINLDLTNDVASFNFYNHIYKKDIPEIGRVKFISNIEAELGDEFSTITSENFAKKIRKEWGLNRAELKKALNLSDLTYGIELKGNSSNGVATLFQEEEVVGGASIIGLIGKTWKWVDYKKGSEKKIAEKSIKFRDKKSEIISKDKEIENEVKKLKDLGYVNDTWSKRFVLHKVENSSAENYCKKSRTIRGSIISNLDKVNGQEIQNEYKKKLTEGEGEIKGILKQIEIIHNLVSNEIELKKNGIDKNKELIDTNRSQIFKSIILYNELISKKTIQNLPLTNKIAPYDIIDCCNIEKWINIYSSWASNLNKIKSKINDIQVLDSPYEQVKILYNQMFTLYREAVSLDYTNLENDARKIRSFSLIGRGGVTGTKFNYLIDSTATTIKERFDEISYNGYRAEIVLNYKISNRLFTGFATGLEYTSNFKQLDDAKYTLKTTDPTITNGSFESSQEVKAKFGEFDRYKRYELNADFVWLVPLKKSPSLGSFIRKNQDLYVAVNPYIRHFIYDDSETFKNNTVLGIGLHGYNANDKKLMGGVFVQTPDFFGNHVKDGVNFGERIQFGLIVKYAFNTFKLKED